MRSGRRLSSSHDGRQRFLTLCFILLALLWGGCASGARPAPEVREPVPGRQSVLRVGAARVNTTPPGDAALRMSGYRNRTQGFTAIHDSLYHRVIVLEDGRTRAAIIVGDALFTPEGWWREISSRIEREAGIPAEHLILATTHTHAAPESLYRTDEPDEKLRSYTSEVAGRILQAVGEAQESLEPARISAGRGRANVNVNRTARMGTGGWWLGVNPDGPSDKTVHVVRLEGLDGTPIALLSNYAVHGVVGGPRNLEISADLPGAAARFVERHYGDRVVAAWTSGAAGDQNPIYWSEENLSPTSGNSRRIRPLQLQGEILGEEIVRVAESIPGVQSAARIAGAQKVVRVPGKQPGEYTPSGKPSFAEADSVDVRLSVLLVGDVAFAGVSGEVLTGIGQRLKAESPIAETIFISHVNGSSGYLADDRAYATPGYEIMTSRVKQGAEEAIVNGLLELIRALRLPHTR